eukprot:11140263-Alexandrium_andersonii.AAC.1
MTCSSGVVSDLSKAAPAPGMHARPKPRNWLSLSARGLGDCFESSAGGAQVVRPGSVCWGAPLAIRLAAQLPRSPRRV